MPTRSHGWAPGYPEPAIASSPLQSGVVRLHNLRLGIRPLALRAAVLDLHARRLIGWAFSTKPGAELVIKALDMAYEQRGKPQKVPFHSDRGSQNASRNPQGERLLTSPKNLPLESLIKLELRHELRSPAYRADG